MEWNNRSEEEVDALIEDMVQRSKSKYITQGVTFNKTCPRQMGLLKKALMASSSFSGLAKELIALKLNEGVIAPSSISPPPPQDFGRKNVGNFL